MIAIYFVGASRVTFLCRMVKTFQAVTLLLLQGTSVVSIFFFAVNGIACVVVESVGFGWGGTTTLYAMRLLAFFIFLGILAVLFPCFCGEFSRKCIFLKRYTL